MTKHIRSLFFIVSVIELVGELLHHKVLLFFVKPILLPILSLYYYKSITTWTPTHKRMMRAFFFSWIGDVSLMMTPETPLDTKILGIPKIQEFFLLGLGSFLIAQLHFISAFLSSRQSRLPQEQTPNKALFLPYLLYWATMLTIVVPAVYRNPEKSMATIPVIVYATVLVSMAATALSRKGYTSAKSFLQVLFGAIIFVISDSLIAINFMVLREPLSLAGFMIFSTYLIAEYLLAEGMISSQTDGTVSV